MNSISELKGKKCIQDLKICLKDMEQNVKRVKPLWDGRPLPNFSLLAREVWSLLLICAVAEEVNGKRVTFCEDDDKDGIFVDLEEQDCIKVENVAAMDFPGGKSLPTGEARIVDAIEHKIDKGKSYAEGTILIVFYDGAKTHYPNKVAKAVDGKHHFEKIYIVGLIDDKNGTEYSYSVTELHGQDSTIYRIDINPNFTDWTVTKLQ